MIDFAMIAALCSRGPGLPGSLIGGLFLAGLAGSAVHCAPMCGGFVMGQVSQRMVRVPAERLCEWRRVSNGMVVPYHLGRLTTYAGLGALAGQIGSVGPIAPVFLVLGALLFILIAVRRVAWLDRMPPVWAPIIGSIASTLPKGSVAGEYFLGVSLGFLPCGFLYAALAAAAAGSSPAFGAAAMAAFGLGTVPSLIVVGIAGHLTWRRWGNRLRVAAPALMGLNAALLLLLAWRSV
jgi:sulfite exporter TauE/SafE